MIWQSGVKTKEKDKVDPAGVYYVGFPLLMIENV